MKSMIIPMLCFFSCAGVSDSKELAYVAPKPERSYAMVLSKVDSLKQSCRTKKIKQAGQQLAAYIDEKIVPHWIGTPWDYNGVSQTPGEGKIACGYFVTTVLRDAGVKINRVKMAQCASETMINSLTKNKVNYSRFSFAVFIEKVKAKGKGIAIIGLDNHTGFLYNDGKELWFIHSSYVGTAAVAKEKASENSILSNSSYKVVGFISRDVHFIGNWLNN